MEESECSIKNNLMMSKERMINEQLKNIEK